MDTYTSKTKHWLEDEYQQSTSPPPRFKQSLNSIAIAGYTRLYHILKYLPRLSFTSFLEVGGGVGRYPYIVKKIFKVRVRNSDLSLQACKLAEKFYQIKSDQVDIHKLPYKDNEYDVVLCSETLEHVSDYKQAIAELLRVAKKMVIITVPHEPKSAVAYNKRQKVPHGHIHAFQLDTLDYLKKKGVQVISEKIESMPLYLPDQLLRAEKIGYYVGRYPWWLFQIYNFFVPIISNKIFKQLVQSIFNPYIVSRCILLDTYLCKYFSFNHSFLYILLKKNVKLTSIPSREHLERTVLKY